MDLFIPFLTRLEMMHATRMLINNVNNSGSCFAVNIRLKFSLMPAACVLCICKTINVAMIDVIMLIMIILKK